MRDQITHPFPNFNGAAVEVWEWINRIIPHFTWHVFSYPCCDEIWTMLVKEAHDVVTKHPSANKLQYCEVPHDHTLGMLYNK